MMTRTNITLLLAFAVVFGAGAVIGTARHGVRDQKSSHGDGGSWLKRELKLTDAQHEQMQKIWSNVMSGEHPEHNPWEQRRALQQQRDQALIELLTPEQREQYAKLNGEYEQKIAELGKARQQAIQQAVEQTRQILTPEQVEKYDQFLKRRGRGGAPRPFGNPPGASTLPAGTEAAD